MKDEISKLKSLIKKYGIIKTFSKILKLLFSKITNILNSVNFIENKKISKKIDEIIENNNYERVIIWKGNFGWNVPLFQRPQHIALNLS